MTVKGSGNANDGDQIDRSVGSLRRDVVEQVVDDGLDPWPQVVDPPHRERPGDEATKTGVIRRVDVEHVPGERRSRQTLGYHLVAGGLRGVHVLGQPRVVECGTRLVVADHEPGAVAVGQRDLVHGATVAEGAVEGERIVAVV